MRLGTAIERLFDNYVYASDKEWIRDKVAWALYQTWKEADDHKESGVPISSKTEPQTCENRECKNYDTINDHCRFIEQCHYEPKDESTRSKMEQVDKDTNVRSKDCETCRYESLASYEGACDDCTDISGSPSNYEPKTEPQTDCLGLDSFD